MLSRIIELSLQHRLLVLLGALGLAVTGGLALRRLDIDAFPDTTPVQVQVNTVAPALGALDIERQVTFPVEQAISGLKGLTEVRSLSRYGLSQVTALFEDGTDIYLARQLITEAVQGVALPHGIGPPRLGPVATGLGEVFHYLLHGKGKTAEELRTAQDWILRPQLRTVPGVAEVNSWGGDERQAEVIVDPAALQRFDLRMQDIAEAVVRNNGNTGGGMLTAAGQASIVQGVGLLTSLQAVRDVAVTTRQGVPIRVGDVAQVRDGAQIRLGAVTADGHGEAVLGLGFLRMGENSHTVTTRLKLRLAEAKKSLPPGIEADVRYDRTELVDHILNTVRNNLLEGAVLVLAVLFLFLGNLRAGLIVASAIPLSMLFAVDQMWRAGIAGTLMSLGAIDFGLVVDSSVILVENTMARLAEDRSGRSRLEVVRDAAVEVRRPTLFGELIIMIVYLPILALQGVEGKLFRPMALTVVFALAGSMVLSLTVMPVLASLWLPRHPKEGDNLLVRTLKRLYRPVLAAATRWRWAVVLGALVFLANGVVLATRLGADFVPRLQEGTLVINTIRLAGVSLQESVRYGGRIELALRNAFPQEIDHVWTRTGTAEVATDPMGLEVSDVFVTLHPRERWRRAATQQELVRAIDEVLERLPGMRYVFTQPIEMRVNEMISGVRADVGVKLFGADFEVLKAKGREIDAVLRTIAGAEDVVTEQLTGQPMLQVEVNRAAAARHGIEPADVLALVAALGGTEVGTLQAGERRFPIVVKLDERYRQDAEAVGRILVRAADGHSVPLARVATLTSTPGPATIQREWAQRRIVIQTNVRDRDIGSFVAQARQAIDDRVALPPGYFVRFGGNFENLQRAQERLLVVVPLALGLILLLLYFTYGRIVDVLRVFTGVPLAAVGGVLALWLRDLPFSISAGVGFVALSGVAVLGDMVLVSTVRQLLQSGLAPMDAVQQAAMRRLRPVLMTALVASLGFLPMAVSTGVGAEVQRPLATVVIGGVLSSTLLTLIVLPALYLVVGLRRPTAANPQANAPDRGAAGAEDSGI